MRVYRVTARYGLCSGTRRSLALLAVLALSCGLVSGCASMRRSTAFFECAPKINGGLILRVDLIWASEEEKGAILAKGPEEWWISPERKGLTEPERIALNLDGGHRKRKALRPPKGKSVLIIFADYGDVTDWNAQQLVVPVNIWHTFLGLRAKRMHIKVHENRLEQVGG